MGLQSSLTPGVQLFSTHPASHWTAARAHCSNEDENSTKTQQAYWTEESEMGNGQGPSAGGRAPSLPSKFPAIQKLQKKSATH